MSKTFCILPWKHLTFFPDGAPRLCCKATEPLAAPDGTYLSAYQHSLDEMWNSDDMRQIRRDMLEGKQVPRCQLCYGQEDAGNISYRISSNRKWGHGWLNDEQVKLPHLKALSTANGHSVPAPSFLEFSVGNQCNLKCRMCDGGASSRIARDPVHSQWSPGGMNLFPEGHQWWQIESITRELLSRPDQLQLLYMLGGEPLIIKEIGGYLQHLIDAGVAPNVGLMLSTNGTTTSCPWLKLTEAFAYVNLVVSIDGRGKIYEYIRYPGKWPVIERNLGVFLNLPKAVLNAGVALQAYNALHIVDLLRFFDGLGISYLVNSIDFPQFLRTLVLPPRARRLAARRLRDYLEKDCKPEHRDLIAAHAEALEGMGDAFDTDLMHEFMLFTNDLDESRGQSLREANPELFELIAETGFVWTSETRHAKRRPLTVVSC